VPRIVRPPIDLPEHEAALLDALAMPLARAVIHHLARVGPTSSGTISRLTGVTPEAIRRQLLALEAVGLVVATEPAGQRHGMRVNYDIDEDTVLDATEAIGSYLLPPELARRTRRRHD